ncbi:hypothetical protein [Deinococcus yavapaiensis]|uniref:Colicin V production protein n=1 Tax=Deinococcus yavapaiensis KR-236 TaxID=694435 RepID=A0A318SNX8_9DEIO|nr:hypothetical protein [Deinococcus yavapaiensis]PYE54450.1 hypothetical protein DES52_10587 [Deinococcus yavapaiensis KR-236]
MMLTWFDALLATLWAALTVLGFRRGLMGAAWAGAALLGLLLTNALPSPWLGVVVALALGFATSVLTERLTWMIAPRSWHLVVGGMGGALLGFVVVTALALSFPLKVIGSQATYPSSDLPVPIYNGVYNSMVQRSVFGLFDGPLLARWLLVPDRAR